MPSYFDINDKSIFYFICSALCYFVGKGGCAPHAPKQFNHLCELLHRLQPHAPHRDVRGVQNRASGTYESAG